VVWLHPPVKLLSAHGDPYRADKLVMRQSKALPDEAPSTVCLAAAGQRTRSGITPVIGCSMLVVDEASMSTC
jgi:hypothetical protein